MDIRHPHAPHAKRASAFSLIATQHEASAIAILLVVAATMLLYFIFVV